MWLLAQSIVMIVVGVTGVTYEWTPNHVAI